MMHVAFNGDTAVDAILMGYEWDKWRFDEILIYAPVIKRGNGKVSEQVL